MPRKVNMFWVGSELGELHVACMKSFQRFGHPVVLHCYAKPTDLPAGVEVFDAAQIIKHDEILRHQQTGSVALGANRYRYLMIEAGHGLYADCDMYCVSEISDADYVFGKEDNWYVNNAILHYPPGSEISKLLIETTSSRFSIPPHLSREMKRSLRRKRLFGMRRSVESMPWGVWGPRLLTHAVNSLNLQSHVAPIDVYYPVHYMHSEIFYDPFVSLSDVTTIRTKTVHLWNGMLHKKDYPVGSILNLMVGQSG